MNTEELKVIKARADAATDGPWYAPPQNGDGQNFVGTNGNKPAISIEIVSHDGDWKVDLGRQQADAEFIAHAREDVPKLVDALLNSDRLLRDTQQRLDEALARFA